MDKKELRKNIKLKLSELTAEKVKLKSSSIARKMMTMPEFKHAGVIMVFLSLPHEVDTASIILHAWQQGTMVAVPKISWEQRHMIPVQINSLETGFSTDGYGLKNPVTGVPVPLEDIDIVVTPGLCFDKKGNRLGRGGGYFDRFFANESLRALKCGVCFSSQLIEEVPTDDTDISIDCLVTEDEILRFNEK